MGKRAIPKKQKANTSFNIEGLNTVLKGSAKALSQARSPPTGDKTGYPAADSTPLMKKPNLEQVAKIDPDTSQGDI